MRKHAIKAVADHRAARASFIPFRAEHEMIDDELAAAVKQIRKGFPAVGRVKDVVLLDLDPGQLAAFGGYGVAHMRVGLFLCEKFLSLRKPLRLRNDFVIFLEGGAHDCFSFDFPWGLSLRELFSFRNRETTMARTPPPEVTPTAKLAALAMQAGHIEGLQPARRFAPFARTQA